MKIIKRDLKTGLLVAQAENLDDLWYLSRVISEGDLVKARTSRLVKAKGDKVRADKGRKRAMTLSVKVEKVEFDRNANRLRILGTIEAGPEDLISLGSHHTVELDERGRLDIFKEGWAPHEMKYLRDAEKSARRTRVMICVVGDGDATLALVRERGLHYIDTRQNLGGKYVEGREDRKKEFYSKLLRLLEDEAKREGVKTVILGGPGFEKRNFLDYARGKKSRLGFRAADTGSEGRTGVNEILKGGKLEKVLGDARIAREARFMDRLLEEISKGGEAAYGLGEVGRAAESGAIEVLLVADKELRGDSRPKTEDLISKAKQTGAEFHVLNSEHEPGRKLEGLGGTAALLRYKI